MNKREIDDAIQWIKALPEIDLLPWQVEALRAILGAERVVQKEPVTQCKAESSMFRTRCLLAAGHKDEHRNSSEGIHWTDEEHVHAHPLTEGGKVQAPVHFVAHVAAERTTCGMPLQYGMEAYAGHLLDTVTCKFCRKALGL